MMDGPIGSNAGALQLGISVEQASYVPVSVGNVVHADLTSVVARLSAVLQNVEVGEREPMMRVVIAPGQ
jgi:hypothetical protein